MEQHLELTTSTKTIQALREIWDFYEPILSNLVKMALKDPEDQDIKTTALIIKTISFSINIAAFNTSYEENKTLIEEDKLSKEQAYKIVLAGYYATQEFDKLIQIYKDYIIENVSSKINNHQNSSELRKITQILFDLSDHNDFQDHTEESKFEPAFIFERLKRIKLLNSIDEQREHVIPKIEEVKLPTKKGGRREAEYKPFDKYITLEYKADFNKSKEQFRAEFKNTEGKDLALLVLAMKKNKIITNYKPMNVFYQAIMSFLTNEDKDNFIGGQRNFTGFLKEESLDTFEDNILQFEGALKNFFNF